MVPMNLARCFSREEQGVPASEKSATSTYLVCDAKQTCGKMVRRNILPPPLAGPRQSEEGAVEPSLALLEEVDGGLGAVGDGHGPEHVAQRVGAGPTHPQAKHLRGAGKQDRG